MVGEHITEEMNQPITAANTPHYDAPSIEKDYGCRSTVLLTGWFAASAAKVMSR